MSTITYHHAAKTVRATPNSTILSASLTHQIPHVHICGGNARCSTCRVMILEGLEHCSPRSQAEEIIATRLGFTRQVRLACQTLIQGDITIRRLVRDAEDEALAYQQMTAEKALTDGREQRLCIMFADVRNFTTFAETHLPYDIIHALNRYYHHVGPIIEAYGGVINNMMGDGFLAYFPMDNPQQGALKAVQAGLKIAQVCQTKVRPYFQTHYQADFEVGIGLHEGVVVMGAVGYGPWQRPTIIGDVVNLASRIETMTKQFNTAMLISEAIYQQVKSQVTIQGACGVPIRGKTGEYKIYAVTGLQQPTYSETYQTMNQAVSLAQTG